MLDLPTLLQPVSEGAPAGPNLEDSDAFQELERALLGKPEQQFGDTVIPAEEPEWRVVVEKASALLMASKDLRVATHLVRALVAIHGFAGFAEGLALLRGLVDTYWPVVHPQFDEGDDDPIARVSAIWALTHRDLLNGLRTAPMVQARGFGAITLRGITTPAKPGEEANGAEAALRDVPFDELAKAAGVVQSCVDGARALENLWQSHVTSGEPDFSELTRVLAQANKIMKARLDEVQPAVAAGASGDGAIDDGGGPSAPRSSVGGGASKGLSDIRSREDVVRAIQAICAYYAKHEPSSPVPLLLERCARLATMSFLDIMKDMVPDGISTLQTITGKRDD